LAAGQPVRVRKRPHRRIWQKYDQRRTHTR
jgi:YD repeat-containing protein